MSPDHTQNPEQTAERLAGSNASEIWPHTADELPLFMTQLRLARLLGKSVRTLERDRIAGSGIPFRKVGKTVLYARADVLSYLDAAAFRSTSEAKAARGTNGSA